MPNLTICQACTDAILGRSAIVELPQYIRHLEHVEDHEHHVRLEDLKASARARCPICYNLYRDWTRSVKSGANDNLLIKHGRPFSRCRLSRIRQRMFYVEANVSTPAIVYHLKSKSDVARFYSNVDAGSSTGSFPAMQTLRRWLQECITTHNDCNAEEDSVFYPTRLIDVGSSSGKALRLIITSNAQPHGGYVTLSHRWRDEMPITLTNESYKTFLDEIPNEKLPLIFQHAVEVTRRLGIRYLWIDCICIFQDSDQNSDWLVEASSMDKVYSNTVLNLSAIGAQDSSEGLFFERDGTLEVFPIVLPHFTFGCNLPSNTDEILVDRHYEHNRLEGADLIRRGWVFQERWLSPRIVHFGTGQLFWECRQKRCCERFPDGLPPDLSYPENSFGLMACKAALVANAEGADRSSSMSDKFANLSERVKVWSRIVKKYSSTSLTFPRDRAIALAGIAKKLQTVFRDSYCAGLWRSCLEQQLVWCNNRPLNSNPRSRGSVYTAPTWSWLCILDRVSTGHLAQEDPIYIKVLSVSVTPRGEEKVGAIADGHLEIQGHVQRVIIHSNGRFGGCVLIEGKLHSWKLHLDVDVTGQSIFLPVHGNCYGLIVGDHHEYGVANLWMLLLKCVDAGHGIYERIGVARLSTFDVNDAWFWTASEFNYETAPRIPCATFDAEKCLHTIIVK